MAQQGEMGRTASFSGGALAHMNKPIAHVPYRATSVLDNYKPSGNGYGMADRQRMLSSGGFSSNSPNGAAASTYEARQWLATPYRSLG